MRDLLPRLRSKYLDRIASQVGRVDADAIVITHLLADRPEFLEALNAICPICLVVAIPYSTDPDALAVINDRFEVITPTLAQLQTPEFLTDVVTARRGRKPMAVVEIGGYFARALPLIFERLDRSFVGCVEDTEAGHRQYDSLTSLPYCVVSIARSRVKAPEDAVIGLSCLFSTERLLRQIGFLLEPRKALVIGYGRVGRGIAGALRARHCQTLVYDVDPLKIVVALGDGFAVPDRPDAFQSADIIFGATGNSSVRGNDVRLLRDGAILVSCSSQDLEFDLNGIGPNWGRLALAPGILRYSTGERSFYVLTDGQPVNFRDGAVVGPLLTLAQGGLLAGVAQLWRERANPGLQLLSSTAEVTLAELWLETFRDRSSGLYKQTS